MNKLINSNDDIVQLFVTNINQCEDEIYKLKVTKEDMIQVILSIINEINYNFNKYSNNEKMIKLNSMTFSNLFSYNENNSINFNNFSKNKIIGLNALNFSGKSSIIDIILFTIYGKTSRGIKIQNVNKKNYLSKLNLNINNNNYELIRKGKLENERYNSIVLINKNNIQHSLPSKSEYNKEIINNIGDYDEFTNASIIFQNNKGFIDLTDEERKNILFKIFNLDIFQIIYKKIKSSLRDNQFYYKKLLDECKRYKNNSILKISKLKERSINLHLKQILKIKNIYEFEYLELSKTCNIQNKDYYEIKNYCINDYKQNMNKINNFKMKLDKFKIIYQELINKKENIIKYNIEYSDKTKDKFKIFMNDFNKNLCNNNNHNNHNNYNKQYNENFKYNINIENILIIHRKYIDNGIYDIIENYENNKFKINKINEKILVIKNYLNTLNKNYLKYKDYEFNPNCSYCVKNDITKEKILIENDIKNQNDILNNKLNKLNELIILDKNYEENYYKLIDNFYKINYIILQCNKINYNVFVNNYNNLIKKIKLDIYNKYNTLKYAVNGIYTFKKNKINKLNECILYIENIIKNTKLTIKNLDYKTNLYIEYINNEKYIKKSIKLQNKITEYTEKYNKVFQILLNTKLINNTLEEKEKIKLDLNNKIKNQDNQLKILTFIKNLISKYNLFNNSINNILKIVSNEVNNILKDITSFSIDINYINNIIEINKLTNNQKINVKLLCGFEKESLNLIFKIVLNKLNTHFKTNFLIIDEGFTSYDNNHLENLDKLFNYIKKNYEWCLVITHIDILKKYINKFITIDKIDKYSHIEI